MPENQTSAATEARAHYTAARHFKDPVKLAKAAHIVRMALDRKGLSLSDLDPADGALCPCSMCAGAPSSETSESHPTG